jgi:hypothetical protein
MHAMRAGSNPRAQSHCEPNPTPAHPACSEGSTERNCGIGGSRGVPSACAALLKQPARSAEHSRQVSRLRYYTPLRRAETLPTVATPALVLPEDFVRLWGYLQEVRNGHPHDVTTPCKSHGLAHVCLCVSVGACSCALVCARTCVSACLCKCACARLCVSARACA